MKFIKKHKVLTTVIVVFILLAVIIGSSDNEVEQVDVQVSDIETVETNADEQQELTKEQMVDKMEYTCYKMFQKIAYMHFEEVPSMTKCNFEDSVWSGDVEHGAVRIEYTSKSGKVMNVYFIKKSGDATIYVEWITIDERDISLSTIPDGFFDDILGDSEN